jgi:hypothetical protein
MSSIFPTGVGTIYNIAIYAGAKLDNSIGKAKEKAVFLLPFAYFFVPLQANERQHDR